MTLERDAAGDLTFNCDECGAEEHTDTTFFDAALRFIKNLGWKAYKDRAGNWEHICPNCNLDSDFE